MATHKIDPRRRNFVTLDQVEQTYCTIQARLLAQGLEDRGYHTSYMLLVAEAIMDLVEAKRA